MRQVGCRNALARVGDIHAYPLRHSGSRDTYRAVRRGVAQGVLYEICQHAAHGGTVYRRVAHGAVYSGKEAYVAGRCLRRQPLHDFAHEIGDGGGGERQGDLPCFEPRQLEQVVNQRGERANLPRHCAVEAGHGVGVGDDAVSDGLDHRPHRGEWRA